MKCPYHDCQKDYNPEWGNETQTISPTSKCTEGDGLWIETSECKFCERQFHEVYRAKAEKKDSYQGRASYSTIRKELLFTFPSTKTKFEAKKIPKKIKNAFNEAERCKSVGSLTGVGACLRKTIYAICDDKSASGRDYKEKIANLPVKGKYQSLLKQVKWLGDNTTKPGDKKYTMADANLAIEILPLLVEELYAKDEKIEDVEKVLAKVKSRK
ncbi:DUF4145 domain-containing protein [Candidatus Peregrinibacteria bacterium]|jgi:hypothetical protein|nr:DUF4145 domain-containing protein [Candidatus Peregrinibacteria bacterium]MBT7702849.1 DUF4145 domain-containing protein [Candidatus Peregrinibacteria bacterium]